MDELTPREREILRLMAEGWSNEGIATRLTLSLRTVESHVRWIFIKLGLPARTRLNRRVVAVRMYLAV